MPASATTANDFPSPMPGQQELKNGRWNDFALLEIHTVTGLGAQA